MFFGEEHTYQTNELIDWNEADKGLGRFTISYVKGNSEITCDAEINMEKFKIRLVSD